MILDEFGAPQPPVDLLRRLHGVDERLGMRFLPMGGGCWAFTEQWSQNDPRRAMIADGRMAPDADFDVLGYAAPGVTAEDAFGVLSRGMRERDIGRGDYDYMLSKLGQFNQEAQRENMAPVREFAEEMVSANADTISGGSKVTSRQAGFSIEDGKVVATKRSHHKKKLTSSEAEARHAMSDK